MDYGDNDINLNYIRYLRKCGYHIKSIKIGRLRFASHIYRMEPSSLTFGIFNFKPIGTRTRGWPKLRWDDCVEDDFKVLRVTNKITVLVSGDRNEKRFLRRLWPTLGCCVYIRRIFHAAT
ncbi:hypothetical protein TNCV_658401 [Trichonephila clavipes]|uniref:Uncharacterized protein n=1 Tax=Trichonephila clavipes TaxID=2585209 RepID=A0A8X6SXR0_TRICX|nr:hypothetical protein TNCV_658401 [Trichonephila clavipes]